MKSEEETSQTRNSSMIGIVAAVLTGLLLSAILLVPMIFLSTDVALIVGWLCVFILFLIVGKNHRVEISLYYSLTGLFLFAMVQDTLHSTLWPYVLVEKIWLIIGSVIVLIIIATGILISMLLAYSILFGKRN